MKITIVTVFIFDKTETFIFKPGCDCPVHRYYRLINHSISQILQRAV
jgi:hypothetical protein